MDNENSISSGEKKFKTIFDDNISFIVSGDHSSDEKSQEMLKLSVEKSPDIILIGGDIVYDNGMLTCYRRWDRMLKEYEKLGITPSGHMIPLLTSVGNHESRFAQFVRRNDLTIGSNKRRDTIIFEIFYFFLW